MKTERKLSARRVRNLLQELASEEAEAQNRLDATLMRLRRERRMVQLRCPHVLRHDADPAGGPGNDQCSVCGWYRSRKW